MSKLIVNRNSDGASFTLDESVVIMAYTKGGVTTIEYLREEDGYKSTLGVSDTLANVGAMSDLLVSTTDVDSNTVYINKDRVLGVSEVSSLAILSMDAGGAAKKIVKLGVTAVVWNNAVITKNGQLSYLIDSFTAAPNTILLDSTVGDVESKFGVGDVFTVFGEDDSNDGIYSVVSAAFDGTNTVITVTETPTVNASATGYAWVNAEPAGAAASYDPGTAGDDVTAVHTSTDGKHFVTTLSLNAVSYAIGGAANEAIGALIYTFPAGVHSHKVTNMSVALQGGGTVDADTPDVGVGSVKGTGAVAVLGGTAGFEDYITGQTAADCGGTATTKMTAATAGYGTGISLNEAAGVKAVHLNIADLWAGADTVTATGTVTLEWVKIS